MPSRTVLEVSLDRNRPLSQDPVAAPVRRFQSAEELLGESPALAEARAYEIGKPPVAGDGTEVARRDFMKLLGGTFAAVGATACGRLPVRKALPYVNKPEELTPGKAVYYATTCKACPAGCGVLVKSRDGRPIKVEGNPEHPLSLGSACARGQASVLALYDGDRLRQPAISAQPASWAQLTAEIDKGLAVFQKDASKFVLVTRSISGPATREVVSRFLARLPGARHVTYDGQGAGAIADAHAISHGKAAVPSYNFAKAEVILSFGADFLGTWLQPVTFTRQYTPGRKVGGRKTSMSRHIQVESQLSLTGTNADERVRILPSEQRALLLSLADRVSRRVGSPIGPAAPKTAQDALVDTWAALLVSKRGKSLVIADSADIATQVAVNVLNETLGNYDSTVDLAAHLGGYQAQGDAMDRLGADLESGAVQGIVLWDVNPVYDAPNAAAFAKGLAKASFSLALTTRLDETAKATKLAAAIHHPLEAWGDSEPVAGLVNVQQPLIQPLFETRAAEDLLLGWAGSQDTMQPFMQGWWRRAVLPRSKGTSNDFENFWDTTVRDGFAQVRRVGARRLAGGPAEVAAPQPPAPSLGAAPMAVAAAPAALPAAVTAADLPGAPTPVEAPIELPLPPPTRFDLAAAAKALALPAPLLGKGAFELVLFQTVGLGAGEHANNPLLQELPDPITKATWGNQVAISPAAAQKLGVLSSDLVEVSSGGITLTLPVVLQPGLHDGAVAIALGFGRSAAGRVGNGVGQSAQAFAALTGLPKVDVRKVGGQDPIAFSQTHHSYEHRDCVRETTLDAWQKDAHAGNERLNPVLHDPNLPDARKTRSLWSRHTYPGYKWGMAIDLNACTGCGACIIACNVENNIPVVGKHEVLVRREMHWLRIDRYFSERKAVKGYDWDATGPDLLALAENPEVVHQPMLCQHCDNASCETVCPVLATVHTSEGLNAQVYNRCIGTRYCANNCAYKVRRFNWFSYPTGDMEGKQDVDLVALALNPDINKRTRGVMEKCSFCVHRIQEAKSDVIRDGKDGLKDGDFQVACQQTCPAQAIVFGNMNEAGSAVRKAYDDPRNYSALVEIGTQPAVTYMTKVRNAARREG